MIIIDCNQISIANIMMSIKLHDVVSEEYIRFMILNSIRAYNKKFKGKYGKTILCYDSRENWRKNIFRYYKASRVTNRIASELDWDRLFEILVLVESELRENFNFPVLKVEGYEGDDIIAYLASKNNGDKSVIISSDKDFGQLHKYPGIDQYDPINKKFINHKKDWEDHILTLIMDGDRSDGVPNIYSDDDCFVNKKRQTPNTLKRRMEYIGIVKVLMTNTREEILEVYNTASNEQWRRIARNILMIYLDMIPPELGTAIDEQLKPKIKTVVFGREAMQERDKVLNYLVEKNLGQFTQNLADFY